MRRKLLYLLSVILIISVVFCCFGCGGEEKNDDPIVDDETNVGDSSSGDNDVDDNNPDGVGDPDSSDKDENPDDSTGTGNGDNPDDPNNPDDPENDETPDEPGEPEYITLQLVEKGTAELISKKKYPKGYALTEKDVSDILSTYYHGYKYDKWFVDGGSDIVTGFVLDSDKVFYADRGNLAGENITWDFVPVGDLSALVLSGDGPMFDFEFNDDAPWIALAPFISEIVFDGNITNVGNCSFYGFSVLTEVTLPEGMTRIGQSAFYNSSITNVVFPSTLKTIDVNAFYKCSNLTKLNFNVGLEYIGKGAFYECTNVVDVILTDKIAELGNSAFYGNSNLQTAYYYGTKEQYDNMLVRLDNFWVKELANTYFISEEKPDAPGPFWFYNEDGEVEQWYYTIAFLSSNGKVPFAFDYVDPQVGITQENIDFIEDIVYHGYKFEKWYYNGQSNNFVDFSVGDVLDRDIRLRGYRGNLCGDNLTYSWRNGVITINGTGRMWDFEDEGDAPWERRPVSKVVIGDGVEYIGSYAFCDKSALTYIDIPTGVTGISVNAFSGCINLQYIYYMGTAEQMKEVDGLTSLNNVERAKVYAFKTDTSALSSDGYYWKYVTGLVTEGEKRVAWGIKEGVLTVGGDASLVNYNSFDETPWYSNRNYITSVEILPGANRVGAHSFENMYGVTSISVPDSVLKIAKTAFHNTGYCNDAANYENGALYISNHLIKVDPNVAGETFTIKNDVISIAEGAFDGCSTIKNLVFSKDIAGVYRGALSGLTSLENIYSLQTSKVAWDKIWSVGNDLISQDIADVNIFFFSKFEPTDSTSEYWRYVTTDGQQTIVIW